MHHNVFDQVPGFFDEFGVYPDVPDLVITAPPFGLHPLEEIGRYLHAELWFPFADQGRNKLMQKGFMPFVDN